MKVKYEGKETHVVVATKSGHIKFRKSEPKEVSEQVADEVLKLPDFCIEKTIPVPDDKIEHGKILPSLRRRTKKE